MRYNWPMRFRTGLAVGFVLGYFQGTKAGRERFEQIEQYLDQVRTSPAYQQLLNRLGDLAEVGVGRGRVFVSGVPSSAAHIPADSSPFDYQGDPTLN